MNLRFLANSSLSILLGVSLPACAPRSSTLQPEKHTGPALSKKPARIMLMPVTCGSFETPCPEEYTESVINIVRSGLEFRGYSLINPSEVFVTNRQRKETNNTVVTESKSQAATEHWHFLSRSETFETKESVSRTKTKHVELVGSTYEDMPPFERAALLRETGAGGVATVRLIVGATSGIWSPSQEVEVQVKLGVRDDDPNHDDTLVWAVRCVAPSGSFSNASTAVEQATRCAISALE